MQTEWLVVILALLALTVLLSYLGNMTDLARLDHAFYDRVLSITMKDDARDDVVIVAVDDDSIAQLGYWPWRREVHARLLSRLDHAKAVGIDILFSEVNPSYPDDDKLLAGAIKKNGRVVLPIVLPEGNHDPLVPLSILEQATAATGHINIYPDPDGIIRSVRLLQTMPDGSEYPHLSLAMLKTAGEQDTAAHKDSLRHQTLLIPYIGPTGSFTIYPYAQVVSGNIPAENFRNKYVVVGAWGSGLGDTFSTPWSFNSKAMSGVEILANTLQATLNDRWIHTPPPWLAALLACIPVVLASLALQRLSPQRSLQLILLILLLTLVGSVLLMHYLLLWMPVMASLVGVSLAYPIWSWRSQEASLQHIDRELKSLDKQGRFLTGYDTQDTPAVRDRSLPARVTQLHQALEQLRIGQKKRNETLRFLSHDMRAPQNSILALMQLQKQADTALPENELLQHIDLYARRTLELVDGFVQLAKAEAAVIKSHPLDLVQLIAQCCDELWAQAQQRHIGITFTDHPDEAWITGDAALLARVWCNLLDNALKYSPDHTDVTCHLYQENGQWVALIQDQGRGVSEHQRDNLFAPFTRINDDTPGNPAGVGLGLAFVKTVVERHQGHVSVQSRNGPGSAFIIRLPLSK